MNHMEEGNDFDPIWEQFISRKEEKYSFTDNKDYWVTQKGEKLYPQEMKTSHIENTLKLIRVACIRKKLNPENYVIYKLLCNELDNRQTK